MTVTYEITARSGLLAFKCGVEGHEGASELERLFADSVYRTVNKKLRRLHKALGWETSKSK